MVLGADASQANFLWLLLKILQWLIPDVSIHSATNVIITVRIDLKQI